MRAVGVLYLPGGSSMSYPPAGPATFASRATGSPPSLKPKTETVTFDSGLPCASDSLPVRCPAFAPGGGGPPDPVLRSHAANAIAANNSAAFRTVEHMHTYYIATLRR